MLLLLALATTEQQLEATEQLFQAYRPPRQTPAQLAVMANISNWAKSQSAAARPWVLEYVGSAMVRARLHPWLQGLSNEDLLERFEWEFEHLMIFHNAPSTDQDALESIVHDDSPISATISNGVLQNPCIRQAIGGPEADGYLYASYYEDMGLNRSALGTDSFFTLRQANECFLFSANNLQRKALGNTYYGAITYVLNRAALKDRLLVEAWDAGNMQTMVNETGLRFPGYGTPDDWLHLVQMHEALFNLPYPASWHIPPSVPCCT